MYQGHTFNVKDLNKKACPNGERNLTVAIMHILYHPPDSFPLYKSYTENLCLKVWRVGAKI